MKKVIYISAGVSVVSVNVINAGCSCKGVKLTDIKVDGCENKTEEFKNNFDSIKEDLTKNFKFEKGDISTNLVVFSMKDVYLVIVTNKLYKKQEDSVKKKCNKFANTSYYFICLNNDYDIVELDDKNGNFEVDKNDKNLFKFVEKK